MPRLIFVVGVPHSGTTLVATILGVNEKCALIPSESGAYSKQHIKTLRSAFVKKVSELESEFVVEKSPEHVFNVDKMQEDFPDAKFVIVVRNPIDTVGSLMKTYENFNLSVYTCSNYLSASIKAIEYENTHVVEYENIVSDFNKTIGTLCNNIGLEFSDRMKNFHEYSPLWFAKFINTDNLFKRRSEQMRKPLFDGRGGGKKMLSREQIDQIVFDCSDKYQFLTGNLLTDSII